jgi:hypothetical protein
MLGSLQLRWLYGHDTLPERASCQEVAVVNVEDDVQAFRAKALESLATAESELAT